MPPPLRFQFYRAWFSATPVSFAVFYALMRPAAAGHAHFTPVLAETR